MASLLLYLVGIPVLIYAVWGLALLCLQPRLLYRPLREISLTPADLGLPYEEVVFHSADGIRLTGWYIPAPRDRGPSGAPFTVLVCHGNGGNIAHLLESLKVLSGLGLSCFAFDYRGYGHSRGRPAEAGTYLDARAAYDWLTGAQGVPPEQIVLLGRSLGASIAAHLAGRVQVAGLVAESAFTSYLDMAIRLYPYLPVKLFRRFLFRYDTLAYIEEVRCPVMVLHSRSDELVPFVFATRIFAAAHEPKQFVEMFGSHNDGFLSSGGLYTDAWHRWLHFVKNYQAESVVRQVS